MLAVIVLIIFAVAFVIMGYILSYGGTKSWNISLLQDVQTEKAEHKQERKNIGRKVTEHEEKRIHSKIK